MSYLFSEWLRSLAAQYGDKPAVTCGVTMTFRELWEASGRCAVTLAEAGALAKVATRLKLLACLVHAIEFTTILSNELKS